MIITKTSQYTGKENTLEINVKEQQLEDYKKGCHPRVAFYNLKEEEIDFITTGCLPEEWDEMMKDECQNL